MLIDWFTVGAQIVNFLVLIGLLKRFLYRPILKAIDERESKIAKQLANAEASLADADRRQKDFEREKSAFEQAKAAHMSQAIAQAQAEGARLLDATKIEAEHLRQKLHASLEAEQKKLETALTARIQAEGFEIARKALSYLAETTLEAQITQIFMIRLLALTEKERAHFTSHLTQSHHPLTVRTAFVLPDEQRQRLEQAVRQMLGDSINLHFLTDSRLVCGIELSTNGHKIGWSINNFLARLRTNAAALFEPSLQKQEEKPEKQSQSPSQ